MNEGEIQDMLERDIQEVVDLVSFSRVCSRSPIC